MSPVLRVEPRLAPLLLLLAVSPAAAQGPTEGVTLAELSVTGEGGGTPARTGGGVPFGVAAPPGSAPSVIENPVGQVVGTVGRAGTIADRPATNIGAVLLDSPGVTVRQGNGGRDVVISIRGNNARSTGVTKNTVVLEDGFILTQPDGASRFDLVDPRAYGRIDVFRGPQSALFGNYATGGALAFRTRTGREIDGVEVGTDAGSFGYLSNSFTVGGASGPFEISLFASDARARGYQDHAAYDTQTVNLLASYTPSPDTRLTLKVINNVVNADLPARASLNQYRINPYQRGCALAATAAPGCTLTNLLVNGAFGATVPVTAVQGAFGRDDRRTIVAARLEHDIDAQTTWRVQLGFDERNFDQPFYTTSSRGSYPSWNLITDLTRRHALFGLPAKRTGSRIPHVAPRNTYKTADGKWVAIAGATARTFERICEVLEIEDVLEDPRFASNQDRVANVEALDERIQTAIGALPLDDVLERFDEALAPVGPAHDIAGIFEDAQYRERGNIATVDDEELGPIRMQNVVPRLSETPGGIDHAGPRKGAYNDEVYGELLGLSADERERLAGDGVI